MSAPDEGDPGPALGRTGIGDETNGGGARDGGSAVFNTHRNELIDSYAGIES